MKLRLSKFILSAIDEVNKDLKQKGIKFKPKYYISNEWGCTNKVPLIGIPYSFCYPMFRAFEEDGVIVDRIPVIRIIRHEVGHAINYAYKLYERPSWKNMFGDFYKPYRIKKAVKRIDPFSKDFVKHLPDYDYCYAQLHPDEDFAETFAVWLSKSELRTMMEYSGRPYAKILYIDKLMSEMKDKKPLVSDGEKDKPYKTVYFYPN